MISPVRLAILTASSLSITRSNSEDDFSTMHEQLIESGGSRVNISPIEKGRGVVVSLKFQHSDISQVRANQCACGYEA